MYQLNYKKLFISKGDTVHLNEAFNFEKYMFEMKVKRKKLYTYNIAFILYFVYIILPL